MLHMKQQKQNLLVGSAVVVGAAVAVATNNKITDNRYIQLYRNYCLKKTQKFTSPFKDDSNSILPTIHQSWLSKLTHHLDFLPSAKMRSRSGVP